MKKKKKPTGKQPSVQVIKSPFPGRAARKGRLALLILVSSAGVVEAEFQPLFPNPAPGYTSKIGYDWS